MEHECTDVELSDLLTDLSNEIADHLRLLQKAKRTSHLANDIQPTSSVLVLAAQAAAAVFVAFERGYRMSVESQKAGSHD